MMKQRYVITSAQGSAKVNRELERSLRVYCEENNAGMLILPLIGQSAQEDWDTIDKRLLEDYDVVYETRKMNDNIWIDQYHVKPQAIDPITGLKRFPQRLSTSVFASPKQRLQPIGHSNRKHPKWLATTGAITHPRYATGNDVSIDRRRLGSIAERDHVYGALVLELINDAQYHIRHVRANKKGEFVDINRKYTPKGSFDTNLEALVLGDYHFGRSDPNILKVTYNMIEELRPKRLVLHDFFDGHSISHHVDKQLITQKLLQQLDFGHDSLEKELKDGFEELQTLIVLMQGRDIIIPVANHHEFLNRYLDEGRFMRDAQNARYAFKLASYMAEKDQNDPVEAGYKMVGSLPKNVKFLKRGDDYKVKGYQLGSHGDKGLGYGYSSMTIKENDYGKSVTGHVHSAQTLRDTHTVGTCLPLDMYYMRGHPTTWSNTHAGLSELGTVQMLTIVGSDYKMRGK